MYRYVDYPESEVLLSPMYNVDFSYPAHLHGCLEVSLCFGGETEVMVNESSHMLCEGYGLMIPPNCVHSYNTSESSAYYTILFSRNLLPDFFDLFLRKVPKNYLFALDEPLKRQIVEFYSSKRTIYGGKSLLYRTAESFLRDNEFLDANPYDDDLARRIIGYIQDNLCEEISLQDLADHLSYSYFYISKRIMQIFGVSFKELLNRYRVANAQILLDGGTCSISQAALSSGFGSIRSFNRVFRELTDMTPSRYLTMPSRQ